MIFDVVTRHVNFLIGRVKCKHCFSNYHVDGCLVEIDTPNYIFSLKEKTGDAPAMRIKKYGMRRMILIKGMEAKSTVMVHMVCMECGASRSFRIDLDNAAFKYGRN